MKEGMYKQFNESRLLAAAGHDLRQPLQAMQLLASSLSASPMEMCREIGRNIECSARELGYMFDVLFDMSKLETGAIEPEIVSTPLAAVVAQVMDE
ncbi:MAG: histidine kinase dimerization/phospho-acceptor domain-containing protein, partial [Parvibaculum sp.]